MLRWRNKITVGYCRLWLSKAEQVSGAVVVETKVAVAVVYPQA